MNEYDETTDFKHHQAEFESLRWHLEQVGDPSFLEGAVVLDIGGGAGMHAGFLAHHAGRVTTIDIVDPNVTFGGEFLKLLKEKYARHGIDLDITTVEFQRADAMDLPYKDARFDLVVSWNAFEHIPDPGQALLEALRVTRPGGLLFVSFDPIWTADSGRHFSAFVPEPWAHLVLDEREFIERMRNAGATEGQCEEFSFAMNKVRLAEFEKLFGKVEVDSLGKIESQNSWSGTISEHSTEHPNYVAALSLGYTERELLTRGLSFVIRRSGVPVGAFAPTPVGRDDGACESTDPERVRALEAQLEAVLGSRSWRLAAPLRAISSFLKNMAPR